MLLHIENKGPLIVATDYWTSPRAKRGRVWCSVNAGAIRVLLPPALYSELEQMRGAEYCILSRGSWRSGEAVEIMWENHTDSPYSLHLGTESFDIVPAEPPADREWILTVWTNNGGPYKVLEYVCYWRQVPYLPWLKPLQGS